MLPLPDSTAPHLVDVLRSCVAAIDGKPNTCRLPFADRVLVVLVDGLGLSALKARAGHARYLVSHLANRDPLVSGFPTTTAAALASFTTGTLPGTHGIVGYTAYDEKNDRVHNQLTGWGAQMSPTEWQAEPTLFEKVVSTGISAAQIGPERYRTSGFTTAVFRGAQYLAGESVRERFEAARSFLNTQEKSIAYLYVPELDMSAHARGWQSDHWSNLLEELDAELDSFTASLGSTEGMLLTADHGIIDVPRSAHVFFDRTPELLSGVRHIAGDPRCLQIYCSPDLDKGARERLSEAWRLAESHRSWVVSREEMSETGWFGEVSPAILSRMGDIFIAARENIAYYDSRSLDSSSQKMIGQHGSITEEELLVPLLGFGAFR